MTNANVVTWAGRSLITTRLYAANVAGSSVPSVIGWGVGGLGGLDTVSAFSDVNLFLQSNQEIRIAASTVNTAVTNVFSDTIVFIGTLTANGAKGITEVGLFDNVGNTTFGTFAAGWATPSAMANVSATAANSSQTVIQVAGTTAPAGYPNAGTTGSNAFYAQWDNEVVLVTNSQSNNLTVVRGALGSTPNSHSAGSYITIGGDGGAHSANSSTSNGIASLAGSLYGGSMLVHADFPVINLANNDSIQFTLKVQLA